MIPYRTHHFRLCVGWTSRRKIFISIMACHCHTCQLIYSAHGHDMTRHIPFTLCARVRCVCVWVRVCVSAWVWVEWVRSRPTVNVRAGRLTFVTHVGDPYFLLAQLYFFVNLGAERKFAHPFTRLIRSVGGMFRTHCVFQSVLWWLIFGCFSVVRFVLSCNHK